MKSVKPMKAMKAMKGSRSRKAMEEIIKWNLYRVYGLIWKVGTKDKTLELFRKRMFSKLFRK